MTSAKPAPLNRLRQLWREGRPTFGAIATIPSIQTVQIMARSGIDWIIVDLEHGPIDLGSAHAMIGARDEIVLWDQRRVWIYTEPAVRRHAHLRTARRGAT